MDETKEVKGFVSDVPTITIASLGLREHYKAAMKEDVDIWSGPTGVILFVITLSLKDKDNPHLILKYESDQPSEVRQEFELEIPLASTPCHYGGVRYWFRCPLTVDGKICGRRVEVLYEGGDFYGCRHCYDLTYRSRNLSGILKKTGVIDLDAATAARNPRNWRHYNGKPTKKYLRAMKMNEKWNQFESYMLDKSRKHTEKTLAERNRVMEKFGIKPEKNACDVQGGGADGPSMIIESQSGVDVKAPSF